MRYDAVLDHDTRLPDRPFTDPDFSEREGDVMRSMLERERDRVRAWRDGPAPAGAQILREPDEDGLRQLLVVPVPHALLDASDATAVGFFSRARTDVDHGVLFELEETLVGRMEAYATLGLLSYFDVELPNGAYGNLVLFATPDVPEEWHRDPVHRRAVEVAPRHYHEVRLHKGTIRGGVLDGGELTIERTKYFEFDGDARWQGVRSFSPLR